MSHFVRRNGIRQSGNAPTEKVGWLASHPFHPPRSAPVLQIFTIKLSTNVSWLICSPTYNIILLCNYNSPLPLSYSCVLNVTFVQKWSLLDQKTRVLCSNSFSTVEKHVERVWLICVKPIILVFLISIASVTILKTLLKSSVWFQNTTCSSHIISWEGK